MTDIVYYVDMYKIMIYDIYDAKPITNSLYYVINMTCNESMNNTTLGQNIKNIKICVI